jgi:hypothetical protein
MADLVPREWALMVPTIAMAVVMGIVPNLFLRPMEPSVKKTIERVTGRSFANNVAIRDSQSAIRSAGEAAKPRSESPIASSESANIEPANRESRIANREQPIARAKKQ